MKSFQCQLDKLPELNLYKSNVETLKQLDFENMVQEMIGENVYKRTILLPQLPAYFNSTEFNNGTFYRVRKNINPTKEDLSLIKTFSYPEPDFCRENGRANLKGKSIFYCSDVAATAILESKPEQNDTIYLSIWQPQINRDVTVVTPM